MAKKVREKVSSGRKDNRLPTFFKTVCKQLCFLLLKFSQVVANVERPLPSKIHMFITRQDQIQILRIAILT